jgi:hypothetical protein
MIGMSGGERERQHASSGEAGAAEDDHHSTRIS